METTAVSFGQYELLKRLARGGMAEVFLALERGIEGVERQVVIKRILPQMAEADDFVTMFMDEARVASRFSHPNIAHVYNFGEVLGVYFLAMEYVDGMTLSALARRCRPIGIPIEMSLRIMADVCAGLHHAHEVRGREGELLGVVHRDVSPQNIMVSRAGMPKILDFGVARASTQAHSTMAGQLKGKLGYIAPEQFHNQPLDRRADVFSVGVLLYEAFTGWKAFVRDSEAATVNAILYNELPPLPTDRGIPAGADEIIRKAVSKNPAERYATTYEMQAALEELITVSGCVVSPFVIGGFVSEKMEEAKAAKRNYEKRMEFESLLPESYPSGERTPQLELAPEVTDADTELYIPLPESVERELAPAVVTPPGSARESSYPSRPSFDASSVTPQPASNVPTKHRLGLIGVVVAVLLLMITGVVVGLATIGRAPNASDERHLASTADLEIGPKPTKTSEAGSIATATPVILSPPITTEPDASIPLADQVPAEGGGLDAGPNDGAAIFPSNQAAPPNPLPIDDVPSEETVLDAGDETSAPPGRLYLHTTPWSKVRIAGRSYGSTPLVGVSVPSGRHSLVLIDSEGRRHRRRVDIRPGAPTKLFIDMSKVGQ